MIRRSPYQCNFLRIHRVADLDDLRRIVLGLTGKGVLVEFVKERLTFTGEDSAMSQLLLSVIGAFAEFERSLIRERQREGIALAKKAGVYKGRKPSLTVNRHSSYARELPLAKRRPPSPESLVSAGRRCINMQHARRDSPEDLLELCLSAPFLRSRGPRCEFRG
jgi:DNA invertase Pin-like site-specific DNA recombinase